LTCKNIFNSPYRKVIFVVYPSLVVETQALPVNCINVD
jgi:hypothetical protein